MAFGLGQFDLDYLSDLSVTEIVTLQTLARMDMEVNRHHLFLEVLQFFDHQKSISPSSFYHSLRKMEKNGLLSTVDQGGKSKAIKASPDLKLVLDNLINLIVTSSFDMSEIEINFISEIEGRLQKETLGEVLIIDTSNYLDLQLMHYLRNRSENISVLQLGTSSLDYLNMPEINPTGLRDGKIREPNEVYDTVIIPVFLHELSHQDVDNKSLLEEIYRILRPQGILVLTCFAEFEMGSNYFANQILSKYKQIVGDRMISEQMVHKYLDQLSHEKIDVFNYHGMLIGILWKSTM